MTANIRTLLICLLMLALPVQGWAAAGMLYCGSQGRTGHAEAAAHSHGPARNGGQHLHEQAVPDPAGAGSHEHGHVHPSHAAADAGHAAHHPHDGPATPAMHANHTTDVHAEATGPQGDASIAVSCTVCAACCGATAVTSPPILPPATTMSRIKIQDRLALHFDFLTDGPRRPPRS